MSEHAGPRVLVFGDPPNPALPVEYEMRDYEVRTIDPAPEHGYTLGSMGDTLRPRAWWVQLCEPGNAPR